MFHHHHHHHHCARDNVYQTLVTIIMFIIKYIITIIVMLICIFMFMVMNVIHLHAHAVQSSSSPMTAPQLLSESGTALLRLLQALQ